MPRARLVGVVALLAAMIPASAGTAVKGDARVLVVLATAGSKPYSVEDVQRVARNADAFLTKASFGQIQLRVDVTSWLPAFGTTPACVTSDRALDGLVAPARLAADRAGYATETYERVVYAIADSRCGFYGVTWGHQVLLTRPPNLQLLVHELGHTFGLGHAAASTCALDCSVDGTGDPFSPMGQGTSDFSAYEKWVLGWLGPQPHATIARSYVIAPATLKAKVAHALVVDVAGGQWWLEYRTRPFRGLFVRFVDFAAAADPFAPSAILMTDPVHAGRPWVGTQETYRSRDFTVKLAKAGSTRAELRFAWLPGRHR